MKKLILVLAVILMLAGCTTVPKPPVVVVNEDIVCAGGHYSIQYDVWTPTGCPDSEMASGSFWVNKDGRTFKIAEKMPLDELRAKFGNCPKTYIVELVFPVVK